jgi:hypothetical protein
MWHLFPLDRAVNHLWYAIPLILAISLVYGATRHETLPGILVNAYRAATWIISFMAIIFGVLFVVSLWS